MNDPVYLDEPFSRTYTLGRSIKEPDAWQYACDDGEQILGRTEDQVESYFWGRHPFVREFADKNKIPLLGTLGGPVTMYAELIDKTHDEKAAEAAALAELKPVRRVRAVEPSPRSHAARRRNPRAAGAGQRFHADG